MKVEREREREEDVGIYWCTTVQFLMVYLLTVSTLCRPSCLCEFNNPVSSNKSPAITHVNRNHSMVIK